MDKRWTPSAGRTAPRTWWASWYRPASTSSHGRPSPRGTSPGRRSVWIARGGRATLGISIVVGCIIALIVAILIIAVVPLVLAVLLVVLLRWWTAGELALWWCARGSTLTLKVSLVCHLCGWVVS